MEYFRFYSAIKCLWSSFHRSCTAQSHSDDLILLQTEETPEETRPETRDEPATTNSNQVQTVAEVHIPPTTNAKNTTDDPYEWESSSDEENRKLIHYCKHF